MADKTRDRPSRYILQILGEGARLTSRQIYDKLENMEPGRFSIQQVYRSVNTMTRSGRLQREGHTYFLEGVVPPVPSMVPEDPLAVPPPEGTTGEGLSVTKLKKWFFEHPEEEVHDSILLHKLELSEDRLAEGLKVLMEEGTLIASTESDFLGTAYKLSPGAHQNLSSLEATPDQQLDSLELKARLAEIKQTLFHISKDLGKLDTLVKTEIEGE